MSKKNSCPFVIKNGFIEINDNFKKEKKYFNFRLKVKKNEIDFMDIKRKVQIKTKLKELSLKEATDVFLKKKINFMNKKIEYVLKGKNVEYSLLIFKS
jgi:uncharacterized protein YpuA (DUF1002 family)